MRVSIFSIVFKICYTFVYNYIINKNKIIGKDISVSNLISNKNINAKNININKLLTCNEASIKTLKINSIDIKYIKNLDTIDTLKCNEIISNKINTDQIIFKTNTENKWKIIEKDKILSFYKYENNNYVLKLNLK